MMKTLLFSTSNTGKVADVRAFLNSYHLQPHVQPHITTPSLSLDVLSSGEVIDRAEFKKSIKGSPPEVEETGDTYQANALLKARAFFKWSSGVPTFADDSGLEVAALNNAPGLYSARYAEDPNVNKKCSFEDNINKLLANLEGVSNRSAKFISVIAYIDRKGNEHYFTGELSGEILKEKKGDGGFGYDPIFFIPALGKTLAELKSEKKDSNSTKCNNYLDTHRTRALTLLVKYLKDHE